MSKFSPCARCGIRPHVSAHGSLFHATLYLASCATCSAKAMASTLEGVKDAWNSYHAALEQHLSQAPKAIRRTGLVRVVTDVDIPAGASITTYGNKLVIAHKDLPVLIVDAFVPEG